MNENNLISGLVVLALLIFSTVYFIHCLRWSRRMDRRLEEVRAAVSPRWQVLQELPPEELADFLSRELDDGLPVDWGEWLREWVQLPHE